MFRNALIGAAATLLVIATATEIRYPPSPKLLYNSSLSAPVGYYKISEIDRLSRGDWVAAYAPDWAQELADSRGYLPRDYPLIKQIWALDGDETCFEGRQVKGPNGSVLPRLLQDRSGRDLPWLEGCITLNAGEVFLASIDEDFGKSSGFDSRYFGPVPKDYVLGTVTYIGESLITNGRNSAKLGVGERK